jgi:hypothetical protein
VQEQVAMGDRDFAMNEIKQEQLEEARRVAFWESHVFYEMLWGESAVNLLDVAKLPKVPIFIVQGKGTTRLRVIFRFYFVLVLYSYFVLR